MGPLTPRMLRNIVNAYEASGIVDLDEPIEIEVDVFTNYIGGGLFSGELYFVEVEDSLPKFTITLED